MGFHNRVGLRAASTEYTCTLKCENNFTLIQIVLIYIETGTINILCTFLNWKSAHATILTGNNFPSCFKWVGCDPQVLTAGLAGSAPSAKLPGVNGFLWTMLAWPLPEQYSPAWVSFCLFFFLSLQVASIYRGERKQNACKIALNPTGQRKCTETFCGIAELNAAKI